MEKRMNIFALKGHKVRCVTFNAGQDDHQEVAKKYLKIATLYTVEKTIIDKYNTNVCLQEIPDVMFNSVFFEDVEPQAITTDKRHYQYWFWRGRFGK